VYVNGHIDFLLYSLKLLAKIIGVYIYIWRLAWRFLRSWNKYRNTQNGLLGEGEI